MWGPIPYGRKRQVKAGTVLRYAMDGEFAGNAILREITVTVGTDVLETHSESVTPFLLNQFHTMRGEEINEFLIYIPDGSDNPEKLPKLTYWGPKERLTWKKSEVKK